MTQLSIKECYDLAIGVGFDTDGAIVMTAICMAESGLRTDAVGVNGPTQGCPDGSRDRGIAQINNCYHPDVSDECAFDPACCLRAAYQISSGGSNFYPWSTYKGGQYIPHLDEVAKALMEVLEVSINVPADWIIAVSAKTGVPIPPNIIEPAPAPAPAPEPAPTEKTYTVVEGDSLSEIAQRFTGDGNNWPALYHENQTVIGPNPDLIQPGMILTLPAGW